MVRESIRAIKGEVSQSIELVRRGEFLAVNRYHRFRKYGVYRLLDVEGISKSSKEFFGHLMTNSIARAYVSGNVASYQRMVELMYCSPFVKRP